MPRKNNGPDVAEQTRAQIAQCLPDAIDKAISSYKNFYSADATNDSKAFGAHHTACKAAIAHIELLLKLASWARLPRAEEDADLSVLMADAQAELDRYNDEGIDE